MVGPAVTIDAGPGVATDGEVVVKLREELRDTTTTEPDKDVVNPDYENTEGHVKE